MKTRILIGLFILFTILSLSACGEKVTELDTNTQLDREPGYDPEEGFETFVHEHVEEVIPAVYATSFSTGVSEGVRCADCGEILVAGEVLPIVPPVEMEFPSGSVTEEPTVISTEHFRFEIPENVYILDGFAEKIELLSSIMEEVSGLKFNDNPNYSDNPIKVEVIKLSDTESELGPAYASFGHITVSSGDLVDFYALIHEGSHALHYSQSPWFYCTWAMEGISTYTTYKTQKYIEAHYPELMSFTKSGNQSLGDTAISNFGELYKHSMEYWMDNQFEYSGNVNYSIGFAFSWYLDEVYGDYTKWITEYEKSNPYCEVTERVSDYLANEEQLKAFKSVYGEDVFENFYDWLKENESIFEYQPIDLSGAECIQIYPTFANSEILYDFFMSNDNTPILYKDLYIDFSAANHYLTNYKNRNIDGMKLHFDCAGEVLVEFYDADGNLLKVKKGDFHIDDKSLHAVYFEESLEGVSFIKLVGEGQIYMPAIDGFDTEYH